jgi:hypothetical protein
LHSRLTSSETARTSVLQALLDRVLDIKEAQQAVVDVSDHSDEDLQADVAEAHSIVLGST